MIVLSSPSDTLKISLGSSPSSPLQCFISYRDRSSTTFTADRVITSASTTADTTLVSSPSSGFQRIMDFISIYNPNTSTVSIDLKIDSGGTQRTLIKNSLKTGETAQFLEGTGFYIIHSLGSPKKTSLSMTPPNNGIEFSVPTGALTNTTTTFTFVPGLGFTADAGKAYYFRALCGYTADVTTTGISWSISGPSNPIVLGYRSFWSQDSNPISGSSPSAVVFGVNYRNAYNVSSSSTSARSGTTGGNLAFMEGMIRTSATGYVGITFRSEASNLSVTALTSSVLYYHKTSL